MGNSRRSFVCSFFCVVSLMLSIFICPHPTRSAFFARRRNKFIKYGCTRRYRPTADNDSPNLFSHLNSLSFFVRSHELSDRKDCEYLRMEFLPFDDLWPFDYVLCCRNKNGKNAILFCLIGIPLIVDFSNEPSSVRMKSSICDASQ